MGQSFTVEKEKRQENSLKIKKKKWPTSKLFFVSFCIALPIHNEDLKKLTYMPLLAECDWRLGDDATLKQLYWIHFIFSTLRNAYKQFDFELNTFLQKLSNNPHYQD